MRTHARILVASVILTMLFSAAAASHVSWDGTAGMLRVYDAGTIGKGKLVFSLGTSYMRWPEERLLQCPGSFYNYAGGTDPKEVTLNFFTSRAGLTLGLSDHVEIAANLDIRNWIMEVPSELEQGDFKTMYRGGLGDTWLLLKLAPPIPTKYFKFGVLGTASFPTGNKERRFTTDSIDFRLDGLFTFDMTHTDAFVPTKLHVNVGYVFNRQEELGYGITSTSNPNLSGFYLPAYPGTPEGESDSFNDLFKFGAGLEFMLKTTKLFVEFRWDRFPNYSGITDTCAVAYENNNMYTLTPGLSYESEKGVGVLLGLDVNLNSQDNMSLMNPPDWMAYFMLSFGGYVLPQDADKDGIEDKVDKCPGEPEDFDGFEDDDGCPEPDNDGDGIDDTVDECPDLAEDFDGFQDEDGCPDLDNDGDGIPDVDDRCPNEPEDFDGFEDSDGCPDVLQDSDEDGVPDDTDKCPLKPEDIDGFQDEDGCPDLDNDLDGILDTEDQCPNEPETFNGYQDED